MTLDLIIKRKPRLMVIGHARHGKDTACEILHTTFGFTFANSSLFVAERAVMPYMASVRGIRYASPEKCYADRHAYRADWFNAISRFNIPDRARLSREIFAQHDIYCGIRNDRELMAARNAGLFQAAIWIDRSDHVPPEPGESMRIERWMADFVVDNNGAIDDLRYNLCQLVKGQRWDA
jgi:hypothetical protein